MDTTIAGNVSLVQTFECVKTFLELQVMGKPVVRHEIFLDPP